MGINNNDITQIETLIDKVSIWKWISPICFIITCIVMLIGVGLFLWKTEKLQDAHIRLIIYGFFMTIVLLFLNPISEKFFAFKLYEEIGKQETVRQNIVVQIYKTAIEQLSAKEMSKEDVQKLLITIKDCLNDLDPNNTELEKAVLTIRDTNKDLKEDISKQLDSINTSLNEVKEIVKTLEK